MSKVHTSQYRVYYEDTDAGGIMYHGNYINFCERGRSDMLRELGMPCSQIAQDLKMGFVVRHLEAEYLRMVLLDDLLNVETSLKSIKNSSFIMKQVIYKLENDQKIAVFSMDVTLVCIDIKGKPLRTPEVLREKFKDYLREEEK